MKNLALVVTLLPVVALAEPRPARDTAAVGKQGSWSVGLFNPLTVAVHDRVELRAHPALFFVAPHADARIALVQGREHLTAEVGFSVPTFAMRLTKGYLFPSWATSQQDIGWMVVPRVGLLLSGALREHDAWTLKSDVAFRVPLGPNAATQLNSFLAPLDLLFAAPLTGFLGRMGGAYDAALGETFRLRGEVNFYLTGTQGTLPAAGSDHGPIAAVDPLVVTAHLGLDIAVFKQSRITVGVLWANYDQGATAVTAGEDGYSIRSRVRSNNVLPTLDYVWAGF